MQSPHQLSCSQVGYISQYPHAAQRMTQRAARDTPAAHVSNSPHAAGSHADRDVWEAAIQQLPSPSQLFWGPVDVRDLPGGRAVLGRIWPADARTLLTCKSRLYGLYYKQVSCCCVRVWHHQCWVVVYFMILVSSSSSSSSLF
jgi:hypothetical protein